MEFADSPSASAYFRLCTDFVDLLFAEPIQQYVNKIRAQLSGVCIDSLFGWCGESGDDGRCAHGRHPGDGSQAFRRAYTMMMIVCPATDEGARPGATC
eukprot:2231937-Alexandrium_andersonii.AAC.1